MMVVLSSPIGRISSKLINKNVSREKCFFSEDSRIYPLHQSRLSDYKGSGFDRGHMVPAADQKHSEQSIQETFFSQVFVFKPHC